MKRNLGFSIIGLFLFLLIVGILSFLAFPFVHSFLVIERNEHNEVLPVPEGQLAESNLSSPNSKVLDSNLPPEQPSLID